MVNLFLTKAYFCNLSSA